jgi:hypothetical protein
MDMRRYLLVPDMDLLAMDEEHDPEPISYLVARQEQEPAIAPSASPARYTQRRPARPARIREESPCLSASEPSS